MLLFALLVWNTNTFLRAPGPTRLPEIRHIDRLLESQVGFVTSQLAKDSTLVLAHDRFRQLQYYLTGYQITLLFDEYEPGYEQRRRALRLDPQTRTVVVMNSAASLGPMAAARATEVALYEGLGGTIRVLEVGDASTVEYGYGWVELRQAA